jgi:hypothetical protein
MKNKHTHLLLNKLEPTIHVAVKFATWRNENTITIDKDKAEELLRLIAAADQELAQVPELA